MSTAVQAALNDKADLSHAHSAQEISNFSQEIIDVVQNVDRIRKRPLLYTDFLVGSNLATVDPFIGVVAASGTINTPSASVVSAQHPGLLRIASSTSANSGYYIGTNTGQMLLGGGEAFEAVLRLETLTGSTFRLGFHDATTSVDATDGAYVEIDGTGTATGKTASNSTRSTTGTTAALSAATWYRARIVVNNTSLVTFSIYTDVGTQVWTDSLTTNIPTVAGRETGAGIVGTNSGTTAVSLMHLDFMAVTWSTDRTR